MQVPAFAPLGPLARWAVALLAVTIAVDLLGIAFDLSEILAAPEGGRRPVRVERLARLERRRADDLLVPAALLLGRHRDRVHPLVPRRLPLGVSAPCYQAGWAVGGWFPGPQPLAAEAAGGRHLARQRPDAPAAYRSDWVKRPSPRLLDAWWAVWILGSFFGTIVARSAF